MAEVLVATSKGPEDGEIDREVRNLAVSNIRSIIQRSHDLFLGDGLERNPYIPEPFEPRFSFC
jgi:hypothetical protein